jgi:hypothetical protein
MDVFTIATALAVRILPVTEPFGYAQDKLRRSGHLDVFYPGRINAVVGPGDQRALATAISIKPVFAGFEL